MRISMSRDISKVSEAAFLSSKPVPYLPYLDEEQGIKLDFTKSSARFPYEKINVRQRRPLLEVPIYDYG